MMTKKLSKEFKNIYPLLTTNNDITKEQLTAIAPTFEEFFRATWNTNNLNICKRLIQIAEKIGMEYGLNPILIAINESIGDLKQIGLKSLYQLAKEVTLPFKQPSFPSVQFAAKSCKFAIMIYDEIKKDIPFPSFKDLFELLLKIGGRGPFLAFKFFASEKLPPHIIIGFIKTLPESLRYLFTYQYTLAAPSVRKIYCQEIISLLDTTKDQKIFIDFLLALFSRKVFIDHIFYRMCQKFEILNMLQNKLQATSSHDMVKYLKLIAVINDTDLLYKHLYLLTNDDNIPIKIFFLTILARSGKIDDNRIIDTVSSFIHHSNIKIRLQAIKALLALKQHNLKELVFEVCYKYENIRPIIFRHISKLRLYEIKSILDALPHDQACQARSLIVHNIVHKSPENLLFFLNNYNKINKIDIKNSSNKLIKLFEQIKNKENQDALSDEKEFNDNNKKYRFEFIKKFFQGDTSAKFKKLLKNDIIVNTDFTGMKLSDIDIQNQELIYCNFSEAYFSNVNFISTKIAHTSFKKAYFQNVKFDDIDFKYVSFEQCIFKNVYFGNTVVSSCNFSYSYTYDSKFQSIQLISACFIKAKIKKSLFEQTNFQDTCFVGAHLILTDFKKSYFNHANIFGLKATLCDLGNVDPYSFDYKDYANLNMRSAEFKNIKVPLIFFEKESFKIGKGDLLLFIEEIKRQKKAFLNYNRKSIELAIDTFSINHGDIFELIPLLLHTKFNPFKSYKYNVEIIFKNAVSGIYNYMPSQYAQQISHKYFNINLTSLPFPEKPYIQGLFTIGSIGSIAQGPGSDVDYWVCIDKKEMAQDEIKLLSNKLTLIEKWAWDNFKAEIHFFIVDLEAVKQDRFGDSDQESSGSAQGKILKEEFYRTINYIGGKIPFWCVFPSWLDDSYYTNLFNLISKYDPSYVDLGNVSVIPKGEFFGASIWQIFKSLKSPYKSVMKMALLEKYIQNDKIDSLLCNQIKSCWSRGINNWSELDSYIILFKEVINYYRDIKEKEIEQLLNICFFLKLGIRSIKSLDDTQCSNKNYIIKKIVNTSGLRKEAIEELGCFDEWPFEKIVKLSNRINNYMVKTYMRLRDVLQKGKSKDPLITAQDLTMLGRKMFVQFSKQPHKVEKIPIVSIKNKMFNQLYFSYVHNFNKEQIWILSYSYKKNGENSETEHELLIKAKYIEELSMWLVHNDFYSLSTPISISPNPTPINLQDLSDLTEKLYKFFKEEKIIIPQENLLQRQSIIKLFITANLRLKRNLNKIYEYTAIYQTNWGEIFCKVFTVKQGVYSLGDARNRLEKEIGIPFSSPKVVGYIPKSMRNRIKLGANVLLI